jgi:hypothetical protein
MDNSASTLQNDNFMSFVEQSPIEINRIVKATMKSIYDRVLGLESSPLMHKVGKPPIVKKLDMSAALIFKNQKQSSSPSKSIKDSPLPSFELISPISLVSPAKRNLPPIKVP